MEGSPYSNQGYQSQYQYKSNQFNSAIAMSNNNDYYEESVSKYDSEYNQSSQQTFQISQEQKNLPTLEKIQCNQWQLRKIGYQEIQQVFQGKQLQNNDMNGQNLNDLSLENYAPWLKNIINEKNLFALSEGLKAIEIYIGNYKGSMSNQVLKYYVGDLIEKAPLLKPLQQQMASSIICNSLLKGDAQFVVSEIIKRLDSTQPKIVLFGLQLIKLNLEYQLATQEIILLDETMRQLFKSNLSVLKNTNKDIRSTAIENLKLIYIQSKESYEEISKAFLSGQRSVHQKEIQDIFKKAKKVVSKNLQVKLIQEEMQKNLDNEKINKQVISKGQKVDLQAIIPEKFLEIPSFQQPNQKKNKLEEMWQNIEKLIVNQVQVYNYKDNKDYSNIYKILIGCLEESNFLIFSEALKCVQSLMKVMKNGIPFPILKHFLLLILDKFRGPKARQYNQIVWQALDDCYFNQCCTNEQLIDILLTQCDNEKNLHMRIGCINWLGGRFIPHSLEIVKDSLDLLNMDAQIQTQRGEKLQKLIDTVDKKIEQILKKALNLQLKESCQYLLARKANEYFNEYDKENTNSQNYQESYPSNNLSSQNVKQMNKQSANSQQQGGIVNQQGKSNQAPQKQVENVNLLDRDYDDEDNLQKQKPQKQQQQNQNISNLLEDFDDFNDNVQNYNQDIQSNDSRLKTEGNNSRVLLNKDQETIAQSIQNELHNLNQLILKQCKIQQMEVFCQDFLNWLQNIQSDDMQAIQDLCVSYLFAFSCAVSSNKNDIKSSHYDKASELVCNSFIIMNKSCVSVNQENIQREIEVICGILYYGHNQRINQLFDSAYFVCSLEKLLQTTHNIVKKYQINKSLSLFISWISQKLDKTTKDIDMKLLQSLLNTLEFYDEQTDGKYRILVDSINFKIDFQNQRSYGQPQNFNRQNAHKNTKEEYNNTPNQNQKYVQNQKQQTYQSEQNEYYDSQQEEEQLEEYSNNKQKSNQVVNYNSNQNTSRQQQQQQQQPNNSLIQNSTQSLSKQIEADLNRDFETGIENLVAYLQEINEIQNISIQQESNRNVSKKDVSPSKNQNSISPGRPWRRGIGRESNNQTPSRAAEQQLREIRHLAEKVCQMTNSDDLIMCQQSFYAILQIKHSLLQISQHPNQQMEYLFFNVFNNICRQSFKTIEQKQLLREFVTQLEQNVYKQVIYTAYKNAFSIILKNYNSFAQNYLINVFMHLVYKISDDQNIQVQIQIDLRDVQYFVESIVYCLSEQGLYQMGHEIMQKLFTEYDNNTLKRIFETELVNSMKYYQVYEEWQKDFINIDSSAIQHAEDHNNITDISNNNMHLDLYAELKNNNNNRDHSNDKSLASILLRNDEIKSDLPKQNLIYNQNKQGINAKSPIQNVRQSTENMQGMKKNELQQQNFQQHYQRNILEDDFMNEQQHFEQVQYQQNHNFNRNKSNSNNSGPTPSNQGNRVSQNSVDINVYNTNQNSVGMISEESILNYYPSTQSQRGNNILVSNYNSNGGNNNIFNRPPQPQQGSNHNINSTNNLNNQHLLNSNNILQDGSVYSNNQLNLDYSNSILDSINLNQQAQNGNPHSINNNNNNNSSNQRNYQQQQQKQQIYNNNNNNNRSFPNLANQNNNNSSNSSISRITNNTDLQINQQQPQLKQQNDQYNFNQNNSNNNNRSLINNYLTQEQHDAKILKQLNEIQQQNSQIVGISSSNLTNPNQKNQQDAKNSPINNKNQQHRNASVEGVNQSSLYDYLRENQDNNSSNLFDGQERVISQPNSNIKMYKTNRNNISNSISVSQFATNQNNQKNQNVNLANYDSVEDHTIPSTIRNPHQNILDYEETGTNEPGSAERYSGMNSRLPKSGQKQKLTNRHDLNSVSPIIKQIDQLSSNRHYYVSQDGKLNFSDMSYLLPTGMKQPQNFHTIQQYNSNGQQDEVWHLRYQEERDLHQRTKENLQKIQQDIQEKQKQESELLQKLEEEKKEKQLLSAQISQLQNQSLQQNISRTTTYDSQQTEASKVNGVSLQEQYISYNSRNAITNHAKSPFELVPQRTKEKTDCIKQLQEILLTSEQLYNDLGEQIILHYEGLEEVIDKIDFVIDLKLAIVDKVLLENMSENNFRIILMITLRLCTSQTTQKEIYADKDQRTYRQNDLTKELQTLLDNLLSAKSVSTVLISGLKILNSCVPQDLQTVYSKNEKMLYRLILKCLEKLLGCYDDKKELRVFEVLTEIYKFFKCHPPENLNEQLPCLKDLEFIFRSLKTLSDQMVSANHEMASEFVEFIMSKHRKSVYLDYLQSLVYKINESIKESQIYKNQILKSD
ncbi:hypothetical protein TTHERM_00441910 (macronuclear) [Tetrahymena thermophila SB210]|uniref:TOG domain-containing protein n=1 Tax=Tetrahymena thermophila (strain SB210) TaxID=312017 RepID=I7M6L7_TETTS|nr:hypothetical protein TTHERM_00441910 [Tetrahymena thermophila SB210]EAR85442.2 hypothetical protein TTHERM_00441910 [Tetrahymena thermophila SB210]|eukprot:XP_001033105.2 hypothetical protein TTHERM_00441910 [Tetrahymena thermophila SB210]